MLKIKEVQKCESEVKLNFRTLVKALKQLLPEDQHHLLDDVKQIKLESILRKRHSPSLVLKSGDNDSNLRVSWSGD